MDEVLKHLPVTGGQRALQMQKVALFDPVILKEYLKIHLSSLYPGEPDMCWDSSVVDMYLGNWGTFVEQWFIHQHLAGCSSGVEMPWTED